MHFIIRSVWLKALGLALADNLWQMASIWLLYILITGRGNRLSASVKHSLATIGVAIGTGWFVYSLIVNILAGSEILAEGNWLSVSLAPAEGFSYGLISVKYLINSCLPYLSFGYLISLFFLSARYVRYFRHSRELRSSGLHKMQPRLRLFVSTIALRLGIRKPVAVWLSSVVESPMTLGFLKPIILIPIATVNHLSVQQVETILLHELAHIRRNDYLLNLFITVTGLLFFFNPFSRLLIHSIKKERENCCDDLVMQFSYDPTTYASALLSLERTRNGHHGLAMAAIGKSNQLLLERVRRVTGHKNPFCFYHPKLIATSFLSVLVSFIILVQASLIRPADPSKSSIRQAGLETQPIFYFGPTQLPAKEERTGKTVKKKIRNLYLVKEQYDINFTLVSNEEPENEDAQIEEVSSAIQEVTRESSIVLPPSAQAPIAATLAPGSYPFVPSSSFSYQVMEDTTKPRVFASGNSVEKAEKSLEKVLEALDEVDWNKIEKGIAESGKQVYAQEIKNEIRKSIGKLNLEKINLDENPDLSEADESRIKENIQLQMQAINNCKLKNDTETWQLLQKQVLLEKLKLQQDWMRKQKELIRKMEEIKKKMKVIYI